MGVVEIEVHAEDKIHGAVEIYEKVGDQQIGATIQAMDYATALKMVTKTTQKTQENGLLVCFSYSDIYQWTHINQQCN